MSSTIRGAVLDSDLARDPLSVRYAVTSDFASIATSEAEAERHPAEPLMAAEVIFDVALPLVQATIWLNPASPGQAFGHPPADHCG